MKTTKAAWQPVVGGHMSIAGGLYKSIDRAQEVGATCMQIFTKSNKQWAAKKITQEDAQQFKERWKNSTIGAVVVHASYLINVGSSQHALRTKSIHALREELERCDMLDIPYLIVHPGAATNSSAAECIEMIANSINEIFDTYQGRAKLLLENTAGQGTAVGTTLEQLAAIYKKIQHKKSIGFCIDTCHAFAAGYDLSTKKGYQSFWQKFDELIGIEKLRAIHCNDSKKKIGCKVDRHEDIGKGELGLESFRLLMNDERFGHIPKICETPKGDDERANDARNIETLKKLINSSG